jgi:hypothetical protein
MHGVVRRQSYYQNLEWHRGIRDVARVVARAEAYLTRAEAHLARLLKETLRAREILCTIEEKTLSAGTMHAMRSGDLAKLTRWYCRLGNGPRGG